MFFMNEIHVYARFVLFALLFEHCNIVEFSRTLHNWIYFKVLEAGSAIEFSSILSRHRQLPRLASEGNLLGSLQGGS